MATDLGQGPVLATCRFGPRRSTSLRTTSKLAIDCDI